MQQYFLLMPRFTQLQMHFILKGVFKKLFLTVEKVWLTVYQKKKKPFQLICISVNMTLAIPTRSCLSVICQRTDNPFTVPSLHLFSYILFHLFIPSYTEWGHFLFSEGSPHALVVFQHKEQLPAFISSKGSDTPSIIHGSTQPTPF